VTLFGRIAWTGFGLLAVAAVLAVLVWKPASERAFVDRTEELRRDAEKDFREIALARVEAAMQFATETTLADYVSITNPAGSPREGSTNSRAREPGELELPTWPPAGQPGVNTNAPGPSSRLEATPLNYAADRPPPGTPSLQASTSDPRVRGSNPGRRVAEPPANARIRLGTPPPRPGPGGNRWGNKAGPIASVWPALGFGRGAHRAYLDDLLRELETDACIVEGALHPLPELTLDLPDALSAHAQGNAHDHRIGRELLDIGSFRGAEEEIGPLRLLTELVGRLLDDRLDPGDVGLVGDADVHKGA
jgi:hypothetical protein